MTVEEIVKQYLKEHKYDGLFFADCWCTPDNNCFMDCYWPRLCEPGYKHRKDCDCSGCAGIDKDDYDFIITGEPVRKDV